MTHSTIIQQMADPVYILSAEAVSPQASFEQMLETPLNYTGDQLHCVEPDYTRYVDGKLIRRMSRIITVSSSALRPCDRVPNSTLFASSRRFLLSSYPCKPMMNGRSST